MSVHFFRPPTKPRAVLLDDEDPQNIRSFVLKLATRVLDERRSKIVGVSDNTFRAIIRADDARLRDLVLRDTAAHLALEAAFAARVAELVGAMGAGAGE